jgi:hypothetical protein
MRSGRPGPELLATANRNRGTCSRESEIIKQMIRPVGETSDTRFGIEAAYAHAVTLLESRKHGV